MICRLPSGDALQTDTIERIAFGAMISNEWEVRQSFENPENAYIVHPLSNAKRLRVEPIHVLTCSVHRAHEETTYVAEDAEAIKTWVASLPLLGEGSSV